MTMKDFKKAAKLLLKRNGFWLTLTLVFVIIVSFFTTNSKIENYTNNYAYALVGLEKTAKEESFSNDYNFEKSLKLIKEKYPDKLPKDLFAEYDNYYKKAMKIYANTADMDLKDQAYYYLNDYKNIRHYDESMDPYNYSFSGIYHGRIILGKQLAASFFTPLIFSLVLGFLFTSMEHFTPFYEFTRMLPWSKTQNYLFKIGLGLLLTSLAYLINMGFGILMWKTSYLSNLLTTNGFWSDILLGLGRNAMFYIVVIGLGTVAGNIFGHLGMMIIGLGGPKLLVENYVMLRNIVGLDVTNRDFVYVLDGKIRGTVFYPLYLPAEGLDYSKPLMMAGFLFFTIIIFVLGLFWANTSKAERSGMLILKKSVSNFAFFMAVVTTLSVFGQIIENFYDIPNFINIPICAVMGFIFYRLYKILFNIKIGV